MNNYYKHYYYIGKYFICIFLWSLMIGNHCQLLAEEPSGDNVKVIPDKDVPLILDLIANKVHDNYRQITTWSGEIDIKLNMIHRGATAEEVFKFTDGKGEVPEAILQKAEEKVTFMVDGNKDYIYIDNSREKPSKYFNNNTMDDLGNSRSSPYWSTIIIRPDYCLEAEPKSVDRKENIILNRKIIKKLSPQKESRTALYESINSDPRRTFMPGAITVWDHHDILVKKINKYGKIEFDGYSLKIEEHREGDIIEYKIIEPSVTSLERSRPEHYAITTRVYSSQCGYNITYLKITSGDGTLLQTSTWEYEQVDGFYLPKKVIEKNYSGSGEPTLEKESDYINNKLNQKIAREMFEYTHLKLNNGDIYIDKILNKEYRYNEATKTLEDMKK